MAPTFIGGQLWPSKRFAYSQCYVVTSASPTTSLNIFIRPVLAFKSGVFRELVWRKRVFAGVQRVDGRVKVAAANDHVTEVFDFGG